MTNAPPSLSGLSGTWFALPEMQDIVRHHIMPLLRWYNTKYRIVREKKQLYRGVSHDLYVLAIDGAGRYLVSIRNQYPHTPWGGIQAVSDGASIACPLLPRGVDPCNDTNHVYGINVRYMGAPRRRNGRVLKCSRYVADGSVPPNYVPDMHDDARVRKYVESQYHRELLPRVEHGYLGRNRCYIIYDSLTFKVVYLFDMDTWQKITSMSFQTHYRTSTKIDVVLSGSYIIMIYQRVGLGSIVHIRFYNMRGKMRKWYTCKTGGTTDVKVFPGRAKVAIISYEWNPDWTKLTRDAKHVYIRTVELVATSRLYG